MGICYSLLELSMARNIIVVVVAESTCQMEIWLFALQVLRSKLGMKGGGTLKVVHRTAV